MSIGRPLLRTSYEQDAAIFPTITQKVLAGLFVLVLVLMALGAPVLGSIPQFLLGNTWLNPVTKTLTFAVAALGINILVGVTGQVSLGHAFFMGSGAYTAVVLGGEGEGGIKACVPFHDSLGLLERQGECGLGLPIWIWLPLAGVVAALIGVLVSPAAVKVRGLYLAIVTVGLVFIGLHLGRMLPEYAGDFESGRRWPKLDIRFWKEENPIVEMTIGRKVVRPHPPHRGAEAVLLPARHRAAHDLAGQEHAAKPDRTRSPGHPRPRRRRRSDGCARVRVQASRLRSQFVVRRCCRRTVRFLQRSGLAGRFQPASVGRLHRHPVDRRRRHHRRHLDGHGVRRAASRTWSRNSPRGSGRGSVPEASRAASPTSCSRLAQPAISGRSRRRRPRRVGR